jgi:hypothetical protein
MILFDEEIKFQFEINNTIVQSIYCYVIKHDISINGSIGLMFGNFNFKSEHPYWSERDTDYTEKVLDIIRQTIESKTNLKIKDLYFSEAGRQDANLIDFDVEFEYIPTEFELLCKQYEYKITQEELDGFKFEFRLHYNSFEDQFAFNKPKITYSVNNIQLKDNDYPKLFKHIFGKHEYWHTENFQECYKDVLREMADMYLDELKIGFI